MFSFLKSGTKKAVMCVTAVLLCLCLFFSCTSNRGNIHSQSATVTLPSAQSIERPDNSDISAKSAVVIERESGKILWSHNSEQKMPMASTTKIMTALVALENCDINKTVTVSKNAVGIEGSSIYLYAGEKLTMENLLYAMLLESANDASAAIAIEVGGSIENFALMMTKKAQSLGLVNTSFKNPHGLDAEGHYTTAEDLAYIANHAMNNPTFRKIVSTYKKTIPLNGDEGTRLLINHNKMLKMYDGACGIKTGFTKKSGRCLVSCAENDGVEYICVTLSAPSDWSDHTKLLNYASSLYEKKTLCDVGDISYDIPVSDGNREFLRVSNREGLKATLPRSCTEVKYVINLPHFVIGDISAGEKIGEAVFYSDGNAVGVVSLYAEHSIHQNKNTNKIAEWLKGLFG